MTEEDRLMLQIKTEVGYKTTDGRPFYGYSNSKKHALEHQRRLNYYTELAEVVVHARDIFGLNEVKGRKAKINKMLVDVENIFGGECNSFEELVECMVKLYIAMPGVDNLFDSMFGNRNNEHGRVLENFIKKQQTK